MTLKKQKKVPVIGISATLLTIESGSFIGRKRTALVHDYVRAVQQAGGLPIVLPVIDNKEMIHDQVELLDGLLLSGGFDVSPLLYSEEPEKGLEGVCYERDLFEIELLHKARQLEIPIFGICRGLQLLNVALGGTLYQDIPTNLSKASQHYQKADPEDFSHAITLEAKTKLRRIMKEEKIFINSFHHQSIKELAAGLVVNAFSSDGIIEGVEHGDDHFTLAVQWHPEFMVDEHPEMLTLFLAFVEAAKRGA